MKEYNHDETMLTFKDFKKQQKIRIHDEIQTLKQSVLSYSRSQIIYKDFKPTIFLFRSECNANKSKDELYFRIFAPAVINPVRVTKSERGRRWRGRTIPSYPTLPQSQNVPKLQTKLFSRLPREYLRHIFIEED